MSFSHSSVARELDAVLKLTNLVSLDLTEVMRPNWAFREQPQQWSRFEAWPALHVFKFAGCWLIGNSTVLDIATVQEVHTDKLVLGMETADIHLVLRPRYANVMGSLASLMSPVWSTHIVDIRVVVTDFQETVLHLAPLVNQVLEALLCLQSLQLAGGTYDHETKADNIDHRQGKVALGDGYSGQLKNLQLQDMYCSSLDLAVATCLTSIRIKTIEMQDVICEINLPSSVVRLEFYGTSLTTRHAMCLLERLPSLTHVTLGDNGFLKRHMREPELNGSACMPIMPSSLRWFSVTSICFKKLLDLSAQECLKTCTGLEYLMLPFRQYPKGELLAWVKSARYVRISDNDPTRSVWWRNAYCI